MKMPAQKNFKRSVRRRMTQSGEGYADARRALESLHDKERKNTSTFLGCGHTASVIDDRLVVEPVCHMATQIGDGTTCGGLESLVARDEVSVDVPA